MNKEKQHYIPKFYLRHFSYQNLGKQIGVFNTYTHFFMEKGKLKTQGYRPFFYGKDGSIESALAKVESEVAPVFSSIIHSPRTIYFDNDLKLRTLHFLLLMSQRNPTASDNILKSEKQLRDMISEISEGQTEIDEASFTHREAIEMALKNITMWTTFCADLKIKLLLNQSSTPFIASDNPVILYNQFLEQRKWPLSHRGYGGLGLQIFFPLSPQIIILFYDGSMYKVGDRKKNYLEINLPADVDGLNILQFLNCGSIIYFNELATENYLKRMFEQSKKFDKANQPRTKLMPLVVTENETTKKDNLIVQNTTDCRSNLIISGIGLTKKAKHHQMNASAAQFRPRAEQLMDHFGFNQVSKYIPKTI